MKNAKRVISDPSGRKPSVVFGIAGHRGHGKTALFRALTGQNAVPSTEFGVANFELSNGASTVIVDVPGDAGAMKNALAAMGGIDVALLVIAADDGIQSQTLDQLRTCQLLNVPQGIVVFTKTDLTTTDRLRQLELEVQDLVRHSFLKTAPRIRVSTEQASGFVELREAMACIAAQPQTLQPCSLARLPIDRCFKLEHFGTVVTGKLLGGILRQGEMVEIHPLRQLCRIRGVQVQRKPVIEAVAGQRVAINLSGIEALRIQTGSMLTVPDMLESTDIFDAALQWVNAKYVLRARQPLKLYAGGAEMAVEVRLIQTLDEQHTLSRISCRDQLLVLPHDRLILRNSEMTVAGGHVLDPEPPIRLRREKTIARLQTLQSGGDAGRLRLLIEESSQGRKISNIIRLTGWPASKIRKLVAADEGLVLCELEQRVITIEWLEQKRQHVVAWMRHNCNRAAKGTGVPLYQVRSSLMSGIEPGIADFILRTIPQIVVAHEQVTLAGDVAEGYGFTSEPSIPRTVVQESPGRIGSSGYFDAKSSCTSIPSPGSSLP